MLSVPGIVRERETESLYNSSAGRVKSGNVGLLYLTRPGFHQPTGFFYQDLRHPGE